VLVGDDLEAIVHQTDQFAWSQQKVRVGRPAVDLVSDGEGFVEQQALGIDRFENMGKERPPEVVGDHDRAKAPARKRPGRAVLKIRADDFDAWLIGDVVEP
jgi:hypothetical protein